MINALMPKEKDLIVAKWFPKDGAMEQEKIIKVKFYTFFFIYSSIFVIIVIHNGFY